MIWLRWLQGHLLQLRLPCEVCPDSSRAERSKATGHLLLTMPKENPLAASYNSAFTRCQQMLIALCHAAVFGHVAVLLLDIL